jgi:hypothetical protein
MNHGSLVVVVDVVVDVVDLIFNLILITKQPQ